MTAQNTSSIAGRYSLHTLNKGDGLSFRTLDEEREDEGSRWQTLIEALQDDGASAACTSCGRQYRFQSFQSSTTATKIGSPPENWYEDLDEMDKDAMPLRAEAQVRLARRPRFPSKWATY
ncbi:hypothetical protein FRB90_005736 [Tulasnella sp. 427]|nr:hypothetical protein FRB90_005736 [Tulasnella sp. 427]